ncbi:hypothetical protein ACFLWI_05930 [Chloroflexota bacterium]
MDGFWGVLFYIVAGIAFVIAWSEILIKAGYNRWLCFSMLIPVVNLIVILWFAYSKWPVYEFVQKGWYIKKLKSNQGEIQRQIDELTNGVENPAINESHINYCSNCARELTEEMVFCPVCRLKIPR